MNLETVLYDVRDGVATITLNRPDAMNAWTPQLSDELSLAMGAADADDDVRAVVLTGAGNSIRNGASWNLARTWISCFVTAGHWVLASSRLVANWPSHHGYRGSADGACFSCCSCR